MKIYLCDKYGWTEKEYYEGNSREFLKLLQTKNDIDNEKTRSKT